MTSCNAFRKIPSLVGGIMHYVLCTMIIGQDGVAQISTEASPGDVTWPARVLARVARWDQMELERRSVF